MRRGESISLQLRIPRIREACSTTCLTVRKRDSYCCLCFIRARERRQIRDYQSIIAIVDRSIISRINAPRKTSRTIDDFSRPKYRSAIDRSAFSQNRAFVTLAPFISNSPSPNVLIFLSFYALIPPLTPLTDISAQIRSTMFYALASTANDYQEKTDDVGLCFPFAFERLYIPKGKATRVS